MTSPTARISRETEGRIISALEKARSFIGDGLSPTDAIAKVASDRDMTAGHIRLMANAYNTAQVNRTRRSSDDIFEKSSEFELADAEEVVDRLFRRAEKQAADEIDDDYEHPPRWLPGPPRPVYPAAPPAPPLPRDPIRLVKRADSLFRESGRNEEEIRRQASAARDKLASALSGLDDYFRRLDHEPFEEVKESAAILWGPVAEKVLDKVARLKKSAAVHSGRPCVVDERKAPWRHIDEAVTAIHDFQDKSAELEAYRKDTRPLVLKMARAFALHSPSGFIDLDHPELMEKVADGLGGTLSSGLSAATGSALGSGIMSKLQGKSKNSLTDEAFRSVSSPAHEAKIKSLQTQAALHDMLANDEVISGHQPEDVLKAYNEIEQIAPRAAGTPMLMRALIRKHLAQGSLDPYDLNQLTSLEYNLKHTQREPMVSKGYGEVPGVEGVK
jgi:hypothetical protein